MIDWLHELAVGWLIVVVFAGMAVVTGGIYAAIMRLAAGPRGRAVTALSAGMLPSMGIVLGLIVGFLVAGLWSDLGEARDAVNREASSLRSAALVTGAAFRGRPRLASTRSSAATSATRRRGNGPRCPVGTPRSR